MVNGQEIGFSKNTTQEPSVWDPKTGCGMQSKKRCKSTRK